MMHLQLQMHILVIAYVYVYAYTYACLLLRYFVYYPIIKITILLPIYDSLYSVIVYLLAMITAVSNLLIECRIT